MGVDNKLATEHDEDCNHWKSTHYRCGNKIFAVANFSDEIRPRRKAYPQKRRMRWKKRKESVLFLRINLETRDIFPTFVGKISENVKFTPYFRARLISRNALFDNIDYSAKVTGTKIGDHGGLKTAELGGEFELKGGIIINPYFEYLKAKNNIYADNDGVAKKKDSNLNFTTRVKINF